MCLWIRSVILNGKISAPPLDPILCGNQEPPLSRRWAHKHRPAPSPSFLLPLAWGSPGKFPAWPSASVGCFRIGPKSESRTFPGVIQRRLPVTRAFWETWLTQSFFRPTLGTTVEALLVLQFQGGEHDWEFCHRNRITVPCIFYNFVDQLQPYFGQLVCRNFTLYPWF